MILVAVVLTLLAAMMFAAIVLYGARIDGRRQALRNRGLHPVTTGTGQVEARESEADESRRSSQGPE